jgi:enamine deaminase RidA (YjgF/YER057c/UK114 family)
LINGKIVSNEETLRTRNIILPEPAYPAGNYIPSIIVGDMAYIAGQVPRLDGKLRITGKLGDDLTIEQGHEAARLCALNILAQLRAACGNDLDRVIRCVRLTGYVNCTPEFDQHPKVINGASDLMVEVFGDMGRHVRTAVGANMLPGGAACEIESLFQVRRADPN